MEHIPSQSYEKYRYINHKEAAEISIIHFYLSQPYVSKLKS
jgi:hypothetical protein